MLCGVGKDRHGKNQVVVWNTSRVTPSGEVCVMARAHTDVSIERMRVAGFDDSRYTCSLTRSLLSLLGINQ